MSAAKNRESAETPERREAQPSAADPGVEETVRPDAAPDQSAHGGDRDETHTSEPPVQEQLKAALAERDQAHDRWLRTQAELENYRKRVQRELEDVRKYQGLSLVRDLLPALDNLERAIRAAETSNSVDELVAGMKMVLKQHEDVLASHRVVPIPAVGQAFDPNLHEAVQQLPTSEQPPMTVLQELQRGYQLGDRVVRPAQVIVACAPPTS